MRRIDILTVALGFAALAGTVRAQAPAQMADLIGPSTQTNQPGDPPPPVPLVTIAKGDASAWHGDDPNFAGADFLIRDPDAWCAFWAGHRPDSGPAPPVDFVHQVVIVTLQGFQDSGCGPTISVVGLQLEGPFAQVIILDDRRPGPCEVITHPFHIVAAPRAAFPPQRTVMFHHQRPLPGSGAVIGRVLAQPPEGEDPMPLPGAHVVLAPGEGEPRHTMTGRDGSYFFVNVEPGQYVLFAAHPDFQPAEHPVVVPPETRVEHDFILVPQPPPPPGAIVGLVLGANPDGDPIPLGGALVRLFREGQQVGHRLTNDAGQFEFEPVPPGEYILVASHEGYQPQEAPVMVEPGGVAEHIFVLQPGEPPPPPGAFVGRVMGDMNGHCIPIGGALVSLINAEGEALETLTNDEGMFVIWEVPPGAYLARAEADGWQPAETEVEILPGQPTHHVFHLQQP